MKVGWFSVLAFCVAAITSGGPSARAAGLDTDLRLAIAVTRPNERPPTTTISLIEPQSGAVSEVYRDPQEGVRMLAKIGGSDLLGAARTLPSAGIYALVGSTAAQPTALDKLCLLRLSAGEGKPAWKQVLDLPLSFSEASPYGMWNRAPLLAVSPDGSRVAITALRVGEKALAAPMIRVLTMYGVEEWQFPVGRGLRVVDLAWAPDGNKFAYAVIPEGDEHTLDESLLPQAGVRIADITARTSSLLHHCYAAALAWSPRGQRIAVAVQPDVWGGAGIVRTLAYPSGKRSEEFSVSGSVEALAYSEDGQGLAVQIAEAGTQVIQVRTPPGDWGRDVYRLPAVDGRLALLGWVRLPGQKATSRDGTDDD